MIPGIEPLDQQIADSIQESIPDEWTTAKMEALFFPESITYIGEYVRSADAKERDFRTGRIAERAFRDIRRRFKDAGKTLWGRAVFELHSDGHFKMDWLYDGCDANGDMIFDEARELKRHEERHRRLTS